MQPASTFGISASVSSVNGTRPFFLLSSHSCLKMSSTLSLETQLWTHCLPLASQWCRLWTASASRSTARPTRSLVPPWYGQSSSTSFLTDAIHPRSLARVLATAWMSLLVKSLNSGLNCSRLWCWQTSTNHPSILFECTFKAASRCPLSSHPFRLLIMSLMESHAAGTRMFTGSVESGSVLYSSFGKYATQRTSMLSRLYCRLASLVDTEEWKV
mmetsp:Transcript_88819/g.276135  ORF Transcript_88819/g.276135 Transcript_88819/m.276135 type:complete len:214 (+) Transcript_88819:165-806(+)